MRSYHPEELFDESGRVCDELRALAPRGDRPHKHWPIRWPQRSCTGCFQAYDHRHSWRAQMMNVQLSAAPRSLPQQRGNA